MKSKKTNEPLYEDDFSSKSYNLPLQQSSKRSNSVQKPDIIQAENLTGQSKLPGAHLTTASRLVQKRKSVDKKIEEMRKQKIEAEMKEVQSKPKISSRSRILAVKVEKKILGDNVFFEKLVPEAKQALDKELHELEADIKLIESCLNPEKPHKNEAEVCRKFSLVTESLESPKISIVARAKDLNKRTEELKNPTTHKLPPRQISKPPIKNSVKNSATAQRKYIKVKPPTALKQRSSSMENVGKFQFSYRSLSPYQVSIKRK